MSADGGFPGDSVVKILPAKQETGVQSLGWDRLEKEMATHSSILAWEILCTDESGGLQSMASQKNWTWQQLNNNFMSLDRHLQSLWPMEHVFQGINISQKMFSAQLLHLL